MNELTPTFNSPVASRPKIAARATDVPAASLFFFIAYGLYLFSSVANASLFARLTSGTPNHIITAVFSALLILSVLVSGRYSMRVLIGFCIAASLTIFAYNAEMTTIFSTILFVFCAKDQDFRKIAQFTIVVLSLLVGGVVISSLAGLIPDYVTNDLRQRHFLGFRYSLRSSQFVFLITLLTVYVKGDSYNLKHAFVLSAVNVIIFMYTDSRLSFLLSMLVIVTAIIFRNLVKAMLNRRTGQVVIVGSFVIAAIISIAITLMYDPASTWMSTLNSGSVFSGRLSMGNSAFREYGISIFGQPIDIVGRSLTAEGTINAEGKFFYIDCLYVKMLVEYGLLFFLIIVSAFTAVCNRAVKQHNWALALILVAIAVHSMIDDLTLYLCYDTFLFLVGKLMSENNDAFEIHD